MKRNNRTTILILVIVIVVIGIPGQNAYAYLDPGTGSYILQILLAVIVGGGVMCRQYFAKVINWVKYQLTNRESRDESSK